MGTRAGVKDRAEEVRKKFNIPILVSSRKTRPTNHSYANCTSQSSVNFNNLIMVSTDKQSQNTTQPSTQFVPNIMLSNTTLLFLKLDEVQEFLLKNSVDIGFITETWLKDPKL